jgi:P-type Mg2+ transporter
VLVIRTRKPSFRSRPGRHLLIATLLIVAVTLILPITPLAKVFEFHLLPFSFLPVLGIIVVLYITTAEAAKSIFYRMVKF